MKDIRKKTDESITKEIAGERKRLRDMRFDTTGTKVKNVMEVRNIRRDIARLLTERAQRKIKKEA